TFEFLRNEESWRSRRRVAAGEERPNEAGSLLDFEFLKAEPGCELALRRFAARDRCALPGGVVTPAVIGASQRVVHHLTDAKLSAAVEASIVVCVNLRCGIAPQHDIGAETAQPNRLRFHYGRLADGVPHVP